jgi:hypothetical protein
MHSPAVDGDDQAPSAGPPPPSSAAATANDPEPFEIYKPHMYDSDSEPDEGEGYTDDGKSHGDESDEDDDDFSPVKPRELSDTPVEGSTPASDLDNVWNGDDSEDDALDHLSLPDSMRGCLSDFFPTLNGQSMPVAAAAAPRLRLRLRFQRRRPLTRL